MTGTMRALGVGLVMALGACGPGDADDGEDVGETRESAVATQPIFLQGSLLQKPGGGPDGARTAMLRVPGARNVLVTSQKPGSPELAPWTAGGLGTVALHVSMSDVLDGLAAGRDPLAAPLASYDYVAIDELAYDHASANGKSARIRDGGPLASSFAKLLADHPGKVILYVNAYNMAGAPKDSANDELARFKKVLRACATSCLALASEMYLATPEAFPPFKGTASKTGCANGLRCHGWATKLLVAAAPGIKSKIVEVLDVRGATAGGVKIKLSSDPRSFCGPQGGALRREMAKARALGLRGVGTYAPMYVDPSVASVMRFASCFRSAAKFFTTKKGLAPASVELQVAPQTLDGLAADDPFATDDAALFSDPEIAGDLDPDVALDE